MPMQLTYDFAVSHRGLADMEDRFAAGCIQTAMAVLESQRAVLGKLCDTAAGTKGKIRTDVPDHAALVGGFQALQAVMEQTMGLLRSLAEDYPDNLKVEGRGFAHVPVDNHEPKIKFNLVDGSN